MTAGSTASESYWGRTLALVAVLLVACGALAFGLLHETRGVPVGPTIAEKLVNLRAERAELQARADGMARIELLASLRAASLLFDALAARYEPEREQPYDGLPPRRREMFDRLEAVNAALRAALDRPGAPGRAMAVNQAAVGIPADLERLASHDQAPVILSYTPHILTPRRMTGELTLLSEAGAAVPTDGAARDGAAAGPVGGDSPGGMVPRFAPSFAVPVAEDPVVEIDIVGLRLTAGPAPPVLTMGPWRGEAEVLPERLRFRLPRSAFPTDIARAKLAAGSLFVRHASHTQVFQLLFLSLPEKPGSFAFDQKVRSMTSESNTLVSPEILARAPVGETRTVRRCFDPPPGWRFDMDRRRVVIVERLGWLDDIPDETMNGGGVDFVREDAPGQICISVVAKPVTKAARSATIGRFEATLVRDRPVDGVVKSGIRALDWNEAVSVPIDPTMIEWKLYLRLFGDVDREFDGQAQGSAALPEIPFLRITIDDKSLTLRADPTAVPAP
ncbi:hypothetical protein LJ725_05905 [Reyranella aquatilis]|uniref:Uncharacterized protein n=1 Tax=Reyranella aquatilis TaxID=2035356 RepID=A0ABS8KQZ1_9HYPH|nr:hypothetical protein [Reyranella aquatilis]MCC8428490.1 hypothetical protein [Reyranella aquatilis]